MQVFYAVFMVVLIGNVQAWKAPKEFSTYNECHDYVSKQIYSVQQYIDEYQVTESYAVGVCLAEKDKGQL